MPEYINFNSEEEKVTGENLEPEDKGLMSRRNFFRVLAGGATAFAVERSSQAREITRSQGYSTGTLAGEKLYDLYTLYTGISGKVPKLAEIDFNEQLAQMWDKKRPQAGKNRTAISTGDYLLAEYKNKKPHRLSLEAYKTGINKTVQNTFKSIDWNKLAEIEKIDSLKKDLVKNICQTVHADHLLAYCLTELMPAERDGEINVQKNLKVLNFLLQSAGREYVESIPAMYDEKTSFGPYQFTEYAVYVAPKTEALRNKKHEVIKDRDGKVKTHTFLEKRGASKVNDALPEGQRIPGSITKLTGLDHHKAAYLFMVDNFCHLVKNLNKQEFQVLASKWKQKDTDLIAYAATAHHGPQVALGVARQWLNNGAESSYVNYCGPKYGLYAQKTKTNFTALKKVRL